MVNDEKIVRCKECGRIIPNPSPSTRYCPKCAPKAKAKIVAKRGGLAACAGAVVAGVAYGGKFVLQHAPEIIRTIKKVKL